MAKGRKSRNKGKKRSRPTSPLSAHARKGKRLVPPLMTLPNLAFTAWLTDMFPDMLWLCSLISIDLYDGMRAATAALNVIDEVVADARAGGPVVVDGRLTSFEGVPLQVRGAVIERLESAAGYDLAVPEDFAHALGMYPEAPGSWLIEPWRGRGLTIDWEIAQGFLAGVIIDAHHGQSDVATRAKFIAVAVGEGREGAHRARFRCGRHP